MMCRQGLLLQERVQRLSSSLEQALKITEQTGLKSHDYNTAQMPAETDSKQCLRVLRS